MAYLGGMGLSGTMLPSVLADAPEAGEINNEILSRAEQLAGLEFTANEREMMLEGLNEQLKDYKQLRELVFDNSICPAFQFNPVLPGMVFDKSQKQIRLSKVKNLEVPKNKEQLVFWSVRNLAELIKSKRITSVELTEIYLKRLKQYDGKLKCVVTLTEELALEQASRADREIASGNYRGPLHGIPWGAKDLLSTKRYKTTFGAQPYKNQVLDYDATVVERLEKAGAVLVAKLSLGALAWGDVWYGGQTKNPWNTEEGSSGSSAGPAAATAAGLVGFSIGSETWGSIVSPCTICGVTGLRPTFGRVSRYGAMALSWTMDKIGPICRCVEDCAIVLDAIYGPDEKDTTLHDVPFNWNAGYDVRKLKVGYLKDDFELERDDNKWKENDLKTIEAIRKLGVDLVEIKLPDHPISAASFILNVEAAAAFSELTLSGRDDLLVRQIKNAWPNVFRQSRLVPAVEYIQANRLRTLAMQAMHKIMNDIDVYIAPSWEGDNLLLTNLTGHPSVVVPNGFNEKGLPTSICFMGTIFGEEKAMQLAKAYQDVTGFHLKQPVL
jgi:Asp-tRNA(Asn)/Glu-tRNA(Gln) amidotransferase A subunit family amidase